MYSTVPRQANQKSEPPPAPWPEWAQWFSEKLDELALYIEFIDWHHRLLIDREHAAVMLSIDEASFPPEIPHLVVDGHARYAVEDLRRWVAAQPRRRWRAA